MAGESAEEVTPPGKRSVKGYASKVFKESSVSAVSAIVATGNVPRKIFRIVVFVLFTAGFLYQCIKFLSYVLEYPTVVSIEVARPYKYLAPAYTFCNFNTIKRSKFCSKYPDKCILPDADFCEMYPTYCGGNITKVPKHDALKLEHPLEETLELGHDLKDLLLYADASEEPSGPFARFNEEDGSASACYSLNDRVNSPLKGYFKTRNSLWDNNDEFIFDPEENELFYPNSKPGIMFSVHSPFEAVNPFEQGIFMRPGYLYRVTIEMQEEKLLPYPYKTNCFNYTDMWLKANKTGPRSQEMCRHRCLQEQVEDCFNCSNVWSFYPRTKRYCTKNDYVNGSTECARSIPDDYDEMDEGSLMQKLEECSSKCTDDCIRTKFYYQVRETYIRQEMVNNSISKPSSRQIKVKIYFDDTEILKICYKPQFQEVEAFSYIGGFIGIWLGVSLVQVVDVLESIFLITRYFFKKGTSICSRKSKESPESGAV